MDTNATIDRVRHTTCHMDALKGVSLRWSPSLCPSAGKAWKPCQSWNDQSMALSTKCQCRRLLACATDMRNFQSYGMFTRKTPLTQTLATRLVIVPLRFCQCLSLFHPPVTASLPSILLRGTLRLRLPIHRNAHQISVRGCQCLDAQRTYKPFGPYSYMYVTDI